MAAHAEEFIEATEPDEKPETIETRAVFEIDDVDYVTKSTNMPPPPPVMQQTYKQVKFQPLFIPTDSVG